MTCSPHIAYYKYTCPYLIYTYNFQVQWCRNEEANSFHILFKMSTTLSPLLQNELDGSTARRQLKSPRSLSGGSINLTLVTKWSWSWSWMTYCHPLCAMSIGPPILGCGYFKIDHENPWSRSCVWSKVKVTFEFQNSKVKVMVKVKLIVHIWGLEFNRNVCFSFRGNQTTFGWDTGNSIFDLENSRSRSWPRSNLMVTFEALEFNRYVCFSFRGNRTIFGWDIANSIFDLENSRLRSWPRSNPMVTFKP